MTRASGLVGLLLALCLALSGCVGQDRGATGQAASSTGAGSGLQPGTKDPDSGLRVVALADLPPQATETMRLIRSKGPFPYNQDGVVYHNNNRVLPAKRDGWYHEYTVKTPGSRTRGERRIIHGNAGEFYWTADHYKTFQRIA